jgi:hypothetical protein
MKRSIIPTVVAAITLFPAMAQRKPAPAPPVIVGTDTIKPKPSGILSLSLPKPGPKPYKEVITDKAVSRQGLFTVHKVEDKWYFEIADSVLKREFMAITRFSKTAGGGVYGG